MQNPQAKASNLHLSIKAMTETAGEASHVSEDGCHAGLTHDHLDAKEVMDLVRSPAAGAIVLFAGAQTRNGGPTAYTWTRMTDRKAIKVRRATTSAASPSRSFSTRRTTS
jgi:hypothetical protein